MNYFPMFLFLDDFLNTIRDMLQGWVLTNLEDMLTTINEKTGEIVTELVKSPEAWNETVFDLICKIAEQVALPVAGTFFVFIITWELISMLTSPKMGDIDIVDVIIRWLLKAMVAAWFISNSLTLCNVFFEMGGDMVNKTKVVLDAELSDVTNDKGTAIIEFFNNNFGNQNEDAKASELGQLLGLGVSTVILNLVMKVMGLIITVVLYSRMITIYLYCAVAPIPASTLTNNTLNHVGINYLKSVFALAMQGVLMMICVAIYGALLRSLFDPSGIQPGPDTGTALYIMNKAVWECVGLSFLLVYTLFKSGNVTKHIFGIQ